MAARLRIASAAVGVDRRARLHRASLRGLALSGAVFLASVIAFGTTGVGALLGLAMLAGLGGLAAFVALMIVSVLRGPRTSPSSVEVSDASIRLTSQAGAVRTIPLAEVVQGFWEEPDLVHLTLRGGEVLVVKVKDAAEREELLRASGVGAAERVLRVPLASAFSQVPVGMLFGRLLVALLGAGLLFTCGVLVYGAKDLMTSVDVPKLLASSFFVMIAGLLSLATYAVVVALRRREAVVGTDGIAYRSSFKTEFIPYGRLVRAAPDTRGVRLERDDGRKVLLTTRRAGEPPLPMARTADAPKSPAEAQQRVLLERIREAMASGSSRELARVALDRLDRKGRSIKAWRDELRKLLGAEGDYRATGISSEELGGVIENPGAPVERRVAAAVALAAREQGEARRRVRIAAQACADEELQRALEQAAEGEIDEALIERTARRGL